MFSGAVVTEMFEQHDLDRSLHTARYLLWGHMNGALPSIMKESILILCLRVLRIVPYHVLVQLQPIHVAPTDYSEQRYHDIFGWNS